MQIQCSLRHEALSVKNQQAAGEELSQSNTEELIFPYHCDHNYTVLLGDSFSTEFRETGVFKVAEPFLPPPALERKSLSLK